MKETLKTTTPTTRIINPIDPALQEKLAEYKETHGLSLGMMSKQLGYDESQVSRYLGGKFEGKVAAFESKVSDLLKSVDLRASTISDVATIPTIVTKQVASALEMLRSLSRIGLVFGRAGMGKTRGLELYALHNPLTIMMTLSRFSGGSTRALERALWRAVDTSSYRVGRDGSRGEFIMDRLRNSGRLIAVDNAHRLGVRGLEWLFDFHDATRCPIALVGNPEVLDLIKKNDQQFSRISLKIQTDLKKTTADVAAELVRHIWPEAAEELRDVATQVASEHGHLRSLSIELYTAIEFRKRKPTMTPLEAFHAAHGQLVRNYMLA